jgi:hypothetical protein
MIQKDGLAYCHICQNLVSPNNFTDMCEKHAKEEFYKIYHDETVGKMQKLVKEKDELIRQLDSIARKKPTENISPITLQEFRKRIIAMLPNAESDINVMSVQKLLLTAIRIAEQLHVNNCKYKSSKVATDKLEARILELEQDVHRKTVVIECTESEKRKLILQLKEANRGVEKYHEILNVIKANTPTTPTPVKSHSHMTPFKRYGNKSMYFSDLEFLGGLKFTEEYYVYINAMEQYIRLSKSHEDSKQGELLLRGGKLFKFRNKTITIGLQTFIEFDKHIEQCNIAVFTKTENGYKITFEWSNL